MVALVALVITRGLNFLCSDRLREQCWILCVGAHASFVPVDLTDRIRDEACRRFPGKRSLTNAALKKEVSTAFELHTLAH